jgi:hypothetical protein
LCVQMRNKCHCVCVFKWEIKALAMWYTNIVLSVSELKIVGSNPGQRIVCDLMLIWEITHQKQILLCWILKKAQVTATKTFKSTTTETPKNGWWWLLSARARHGASSGSRGDSWKFAGVTPTFSPSTWTNLDQANDVGLHAVGGGRHFSNSKQICSNRNWEKCGRGVSRKKLTK